MIKREADGWYVIFAVDETKKEVPPAPKESVGVDVGIESFATLSDDEAAPVENPQFSPRRTQVKASRPAGFTPHQRKQTTKESGSSVGEEAFESETT
jgi:transposase